MYYLLITKYMKIKPHFTKDILIKVIVIELINTCDY